MPGKVKVKVLAGRNLPVMDRGSDTTDAYVEIKIGGVTHKTDVCRKTLNPQWNTDWYRFEVDDAELQDEPLQIRLMDYDTYSANDAIGKVYISLHPLLLSPALVIDNYTMPISHSGKGGVMSGWIPVFDTMHGIRGEVNVIVKVELFSDVNKFRQSSCGLHFFHSPVIPHGYQAQVIHGFVDELVVNDDPEYQWIDKIRTPRASNEARQVVFLKLSGQVQRKIGLKALDLGANAVIGYTQCFDLEGDVGVVARGAGTAVTLVKLHDNACHQSNNYSNVQDSAQAEDDRMGSSPVHKQQGAYHQRTESMGNKTSQSPVKHPHGLSINSSHRRSSDSDLSITPKTNSVERAQACGRMYAMGMLRPSMHQDNIELLEYPFLTLVKYPPGFILSLGGTVTARSVKLLERVPNPDEPETRDTWWTELRMEIRSHARALACNVVLGYSEATTISDDICVLSATGTAAVINLNYNCTPMGEANLETVNYHKPSTSAHPSTMHGTGTEFMTTSLDRIRFEREAKSAKSSDQKESTSKGAHGHALEHHSHSLPEETSPKISNPPYAAMPSACSICHIPYTKASVPFRIKMIKCAVCRSGKVPNVLFCTVEVPDTLQVTGRGCLVQAHVMKPKRDLKSEMNAREISDSLPFLEYELHRLLISKLKVKGMNAIFGLKTTVAIGERMIAAIATGTAVFLTALPPPCIPTVISGNSLKDLPRLAELQRAMQDTLDTNRDVYQLNPSVRSDGNKTYPSDTDDSDDELADLDLGAGNKDACIIEVDDTEDLEMLSLLMEPRPPNGFHVVNTQAVPGLQGLEIIRNLQTFVQVWRAKLPHNQPNSTFSKHFQRLLQSVYFKLRSMIPCAVCDLRFRLDLPESDELQLLVTGMALGLGEPSKFTTTNKKFLSHSLSKDHVQRDNDLIFSLEEEQSADANQDLPASSPLQEKLNNLALLRNKSSGLSLSRHLPLRERYGVDITPLSYVPGGRIDRYLGNLNFFFIRESTSIRENGGISGFVHGFITEILAVVRAHATALGGNALVAYYMTELILVDNVHKNQGQCIVSVGGDVVFVSYFTDE